MKNTSTINRNNYEAYIVDYWDGNLSPDLTEALFYFLNQHPEIKKEILDAGQFSLPQDDLTYDAKNEILRNEVGHSNIDTFLVAELEQDLLPHEINELNLFLAAHPQYERDRNLFAHTKLKPGIALKYPNKNSLKKGSMMPLLRYSAVAAAACLFVVLGLGFFNSFRIGLTASRNGINFLPSNIIANQKNAGTLAVSDKRNLSNSPPIPVPALVQKVSPAGNTKIELKQLPVINKAPDNFYSYSQSRLPEDYLEALVNSYVPQHIFIAPEVKQPVDPGNDKKGNAKHGIASINLQRILKDSALAQAMENSGFTLKTKAAKALAWATGKASNGKVIVQAIPHHDGSLAALSFTNGKYNYTKRF